ncbi:MAG: hypothetical protein JNK05_09135 [Myxococcales bacterium]|nr:hypothetical protein [Myxococcales bacterium]
MPVAGLVLTLADDDALASHAITALSAIESVTLGALQPGRKLPLATSVETLDAQATLWQDITRIPGVLLMDLVFEDFSDVEPESFSSDELPSRWRNRAHTFNSPSSPQEP